MRSPIRPNKVNLLLFAIVLISVVLFIYLTGRKGPIYTLESLQTPIDDLVERGVNGGYLVIDIVSTKSFLQFSKYVISKSNFGIELAFPKVAWSERYFGKLQDFCVSNRVRYWINAGTHEGECDYLRVDYGKDSRKAYEDAKRILREVFNVDDSTRYMFLIVRIRTNLIKSR